MSFFRFASCLRGEPRLLGRGGALQPRYRRVRRHYSGCCKRAASRPVSKRLSVYGDAAITLGLPFVAGGVPQHPPEPGAGVLMSSKTAGMLLCPGAPVPQPVFSAG